MMKHADGKIAGALIFVGAVQFILCMIMAECLYPKYSVSENYISDLGVGATAPIFNISVFLLGATVAASAYFLKRMVQSKILLGFLTHAMRNRRYGSWNIPRKLSMHGAHGLCSNHFSLWSIIRHSLL